MHEPGGLAPAAWPGDVAAAACDRADEDFRFSLLAEAFPDRRADLALAIGACLARETSRARLADEAGRRFVLHRLDELARLEPRAAHEIAKSMQPAVAKSIPASDGSRVATSLREAVALHARFASQTSLDAELRKLGFDLDGPGAAPEGFGVIDTLEAKGRLVQFDPETDQWPNEHDHLARQLAHAVGRDLAGVVFEDVAPAEDSDDPYLVRAYFDGVVLETDARDNGDWYDVDAVVGLVNAVLVRRRSERRVALTFLGGNNGVAVAGPGRAIRAAHAAGFLDLVQNGGERVEDARANERKVLRDMGATELQ